MSVAMRSDLWAMSASAYACDQSIQGACAEIPASDGVRRSASAEAWRSNLEITFLLFLFHRRRAVVVDHAALTFGAGGEQHLLNDLRQRRRFTLDGAGERIAAERTKAHRLHFRTFAILQRHALVVHHDQRAVTTHDRAWRGEVQRHNGNLFEVDVLPDIQLSPVGKREHAQAFSLVLARVVLPPKFRALTLGIPAMLSR